VPKSTSLSDYQGPTNYNLIENHIHISWDGFFN
jgi:hypothetical protein